MDCTICVAETNKGTDELRGYRADDLHLCFCICIRFSHDGAQMCVLS